MIALGLLVAALGVGPVPAAGAPQPTSLPEAGPATRQLVLTLDSTVAFLNGRSVALTAPARLVGGRTLVPLGELVRVLGLPLETLEGGLRLGRLDVYPAAGTARLDGRDLKLADVGDLVGGELYLAVRAVEVAIGATVAYDPGQRLITLTLGRDRLADLGQPVARFATDKREYRLGEPVRVMEYSYDPDGLPLVGKKFTGREEVYFTPGPHEISLVVTNSAGRSSAPYTVRVNVTATQLATPRDYALRNLPPGRTFADPDVLGYASLAPTREDLPTPLIVSNSPEVFSRSGLVYEETVSGPARLVAHHLSAMSGPARVLVAASNLEDRLVSVRATSIGETAATRVIATLGQVSLLDFLTSDGRAPVSLAPGQSAVLYASTSLAPGHGVNAMMDLETSGRVTLSVFVLEESLFPAPGAALPIEALRSLPVLEPDGQHPRGTFPGAVRRLKLNLAGLLPARPGASGPGASGVGRLVIGDGAADPALVGRDALTGKPAVLTGNYGVSYRITLENASGTVGAFVPRGGPYSGAIRVDGELMALPGNGVLMRQDSPFLLYRDLGVGAVEIEFVPASGSYLPVNLLFYRLDPPGPGLLTRR